jgi:predicted amidohydrolase
MKSLLQYTVLLIFCILPLYLISGVSARANDWGCQVILCLSNPGGPTQYAECRPPIQKLWRELAKGHSFPACSSVVFQSSRPGYEPNYCDAGYGLSGSFGPRGEQATCVSTAPRQVSNSLCSYDRDNHGSGSDSIISPRWQRVGGRLRCMGDGVGKQRVWY